MHRYKTWNGPMPTTAAQAAVTTGTTIKTMLQLATPATRQIQLISWGYAISEAAGAVGTVELLQTDVAATVTAHVAAGVQPLDPNAPASLLTLGTSATGYTSTSEGATTAARVFDVVRLPASLTGSGTPYAYQWMPDERPIIAVSKFLRVRATTPTSGCNMVCWVCWDE
jgi:hypothetical protein